MVWTVKGADSATGRDVSTALEAPDEPSARVAARAHGILVESVVLVTQESLEAMTRPVPAEASARLAADYASGVNLTGAILAGVAILLAFASLCGALVAVGTSNLNLGLSSVGGVASAAFLGSWAYFTRFLVAIGLKLAQRKE